MLFLSRCSGLFVKPNLISDVFCAGVLVLSEFAGAAQSLGAGAILVNPWNITDMAAAIEDALTMSEQARAHPARTSCTGKRAEIQEIETNSRAG